MRTTPTSHIPVHPQPGFYETTLATRDENDWDSVGPGEVERIVARPAWSSPAYDVDKAWNRIEVQFIAEKTRPKKKRRR